MGCPQAYSAIYQRVRIAARDTRRIEAAAHTPVYTFFGDVLRGRETIAAFGSEHKRLFAAANERLVRDLATAQVGNQAVGKWAQALTVQNGALMYLGLFSSLLGLFLGLFLHRRR
jgi:hypothetical protein